MKKLVVPFLLTFLLSILLVGCSNEAENNTYDTISISDVESKMDEGYLVLDVREPNEFEEGHIPGAINKPLSELEADDFSNLNKDDQYVVICRSGNRSQTASEILFAEGYKIVNTSEGMSSWQGEIE